MSDKLTPERLREIREREQKATEAYLYNGLTQRTFEIVLGSDFVFRLYGENAANDARFIAHARTDIPLLLAEIERLQNTLNEIKSLNTNHCVLQHAISIAKRAQGAK